MTGSMPDGAPQLSAAASDHVRELADGLVDEEAGLDGCALCNEIRAYVIATDAWIAEVSEGAVV